jgi:hypothetical protein
MPVEQTASYVRIRVASPSKFSKFRVITLGKGIKAVLGIISGKKSQIQSILFPRSRYTLAQAKAWIKSHGYSVHESFLVTDILLGENYIEFQESLITSEIEAELALTEHVDVDTLKKETWEWLVDGMVGD